MTLCTDTFEIILCEIDKLSGADGLVWRILAAAMAPWLIIFSNGLLALLYRILAMIFQIN